MEETSFAIELTLEDGYRMSIDFGPGLGGGTLDEPPPLGSGTGPNPARMLASAVGGCLGASLLFCLRRSRAEVSGLGVAVAGRMVRNDGGRWRIGGMTVTLRPELPETERDRVARCIGLFEDFCIVTESVRRGIPIEVEVEPVTPAVPVLSGA